MTFQITQQTHAQVEKTENYTRTPMTAESLFSVLMGRYRR